MFVGLPSSQIIKVLSKFPIFVLALLKYCLPQFSDFTSNLHLSFRELLPRKFS